MALIPTSICRQNSLEVLDLGVSLVLFKPECSYLTDAEREWLSNIVSMQTRLNGGVLFQFPVRIDREMAVEIWEPAVGRFPWASEYYGCMSGDCIALVLKGRASAQRMKNIVRASMAGAIDRIARQLGVSFIPDLVHGSDPGQASREMAILGIDTSDGFQPWNLPNLAACSV